MFIGSLGGQIVGNYGTYVAGADGTANVDSRDISALLAAGAELLVAQVFNYGMTPVVVAAAAGKFVGSTSLANGTLSVAAQPDVPRQGAVVVAAGTSAVTGGTISIPYLANDGTSQVDVFSLAAPASGTATTFTSKGIVHLSAPTVAGLVGGTSPGIQIDSTAAISVPVNPGAKDVVFIKETTNAGDETVGTASAVTLATITPSSAPNASHTYGFMYSFNAPLTGS
jgi:hypothetical protein